MYDTQECIFLLVYKKTEKKLRDDIFGSLFSIVLKRRVAQKGLLKITADKYSLVVSQAGGKFLFQSLRDIGQCHGKCLNCGKWILKVQCVSIVINSSKLHNLKEKYILLYVFVPDRFFLNTNLFSSVFNLKVFSGFLCNPTTKIQLIDLHKSSQYRNVIHVKRIHT